MQSCENCHAKNFGTWSPGFIAEGDRERLRRLIKAHEGLRLTAYRDGRGWSIGYGWHIRDRGLLNALNAGGSVQIDAAAAEALLDIGLDEAIDKIEKWLGKVPAGARGAALIDMAYTMSPQDLATFLRLHAAASVGDWPTAAAEAVDSKWAIDVGSRRSAHIYEMLATGLWPPGLAA